MVIVYKFVYKTMKLYDKPLDKQSNILKPLPM